MVLRVILQIVPYGDEDNIREIGRLDIYNKGPINLACLYGCIDLTKGKEGLYKYDTVHYREDGPWELIRNVIETCDIS